MYNLILDSDALIKLTQSEIITKLCSVFDCIITDAIKKETVDEGKKRFYPDADIIEELIKNRLLKIKNPEKLIKIEEEFGEGELSVLSLYKNGKNHIIISDDHAFIRYLEKENIDFLVPADLILLLKKFRKISLKESLYYLDKMKVFIKEEIYKDIKEELGGK